MPPLAEFRRESYFCLARPSQNKQIGHHKSHDSGKQIHTLLSRPIRSTYRSAIETMSTPVAEKLAVKKSLLIKVIIRHCTTLSQRILLLAFRYSGVHPNKSSNVITSLSLVYTGRSKRPCLMMLPQERAANISRATFRIPERRGITFSVLR